MRRLLLSIISMLCMVCAVANPVSQDQALKKAKAFLEKKGMAVNATLNLAYQGRQMAHQQGAPAKNAFYYVFNNGNNAGFVIVAGDDCAEDVLGYADSGTFDADNIPENMQAFLQGYAGQISAARANGLSTTSSNDVEVARKVVAPLIETHWNQRDPYNQMCIKPNGDKCVTGCVATALAQVMYYYQWPKEATTEIPNTFGNSYDNLPSTTFKWDKMKLTYVNTGENDEEAEEAVAELMWYCGHAVKMSYGTGSSGAYEGYIPDALKNYFGYPGNPTFAQRYNYTTEEWDELIYNELKNCRPVLYGADTSGGGGHEFICDGYDGHGLYHINWGWGGNSDGYFRLQALRPSSQGTGGSGDYGGYSLDHDAIIGVSNTVIAEESEPASSALRTLDLRATNSVTTLEYVSDYGFKDVYVYYKYNLSGTQDGIDVGLGLYQDGKLLQKIVLQTNLQLGVGYYYYHEDYRLYDLGINLDDGNYQIMGINRVNGTEEWFPNEGPYLIDVEISNGNVTITNVEKSNTLSIEVTRVEDRFDLLEDVSQVRAYVKNTGNADYSGSLALYIDDVQMAKEGVYLPVDGEDYVDFFFSYMPGSVDLEITDASGSVLYTKDGFVLREWSAQQSPLATVEVNMKNFNEDKTKMYGSVLDGTVTLRNDGSTDIEGNLTLEVHVFEKEEGGYTYYSKPIQLIPISIKAGEEKAIPVYFSAMAVGDKFRYALFDPFGNSLASKYGFVETVPGVVYWKGNGERYAVAPTDKIMVPDGTAAVSFEDIDLGDYEVDLSDNSNINAIYYVATERDSYKINAANIVIGNQSRGMLLFEDYDFFVPKRFFVKEARYSYLPEVGADGKNGWQTITLPFTVKKVVSGNKEVDWYHGNDTEEKDFWVREFKQVVGNTVKFADVQTWMPNVPYIFAVPGSRWGSEYDLTGKILEFSASDVWVEKSTVSAVVSDSYEFIGITGGTNYTSRDEEYAGMMARMENAYVLNDNGNAFVKGTTNWKGNHNLCYFTINDRTIEAPVMLNIGTFDETDGICMPQVTAEDGQQVDVYTIDGMKVAAVTVSGGKVNLDQLPKGVYIVEGKKIVK